MSEVHRKKTETYPGSYESAHPEKDRDEQTEQINVVYWMKGSHNNLDKDTKPGLCKGAII